MRRLICAAVIATILAPLEAVAETPCDFKGLSAGDKLTPAAAMAILGVKQFKTNPKRQSFEQSQPNVTKYGIIAAAEMEDQLIGPYCDATACKIPFGVTVGNNSTPVTVYVGLRDNVVTEINVIFNVVYWEDLLPVIKNKYGPSWLEEHHQDVITDYETKQKYPVDWTTLNQRISGTNKKTGDKCQIWATNYDMVFTHHDANGPLHSIFVIKLVSKNF